MARTLVAASSQHLDAASAAATAVPLSMSAWVNLASTGVAHRFIALTDGSTSNRFVLGLSAANQVTGLSVSGGTARTATASGTVSQGVWTAVGVTFFSATSRTAFRNGANAGSDTVSNTPSGINATSLGWDKGTTFLDGTIAWPAIWAGALSADEHLALAQGLDPRLLQSSRATLVAFWPLIGGSPEPDAVGSRNLTLTGTPAYADNPLNLIVRGGRPRRVATPGSRKVLPR